MNWVYIYNFTSVNYLSQSLLFCNLFCTELLLSFLSWFDLFLFFYWSLNCFSYNWS